MGGELLVYIFGFIGILSPALFLLEKMYKRNVHNNEFSNEVKDADLDSLRYGGILSDTEYEKAYLKFNEIKQKNENKKKYDNGVDVLYKLSEADIISEKTLLRKYL